MSKVGTFVKLKIGDTLMIGESSVSLAMAIEAIETSSKASGYHSTFEYGRINETLSVESIASSDSTETDYNFMAARTAAKAQTKVDFELTEYDDAGVAVTDAHKVTGSAVITSVTWDAPDNDVQTFSVELQADGATTDSVVTV
jgi:predicted secreted protein